jgi:hypothetical protein
MRAYIRNLIIFFSVEAVVPLCIIGASVQMLRRRTYILCLCGCILAVLPLANPCCLLTIPFGIWGLVALSLADVRQAFG